MENNFRERHRKNADRMRRIRDVAMGVIILLIGAVVLLANKIGLALTIEPLMQYLFGGLCLLYGSFRLYRGIKHDY